MALSTFVISFCFVLPLWLKAEVFPDFDSCREFFYKNHKPTGFDQNYVTICQRYRNIYRYATLYSKQDRIPVYSAYRLDPTCSKNKAGRRATWFIEPELSGQIGAADMTNPGNRNELWKINQAIDDFYKDTGYDRGHLNPNSYQCDDGRIATFTLTNAVPMDACFNRIQWKIHEDKMKNIINLNEGDAYFVTGVVFSSKKIPIPNVDSTETSREFEKVTIPSHMWTALCFHAKKEEESFSFGYIGENKAEAVVNTMHIDDLKMKLRRLYGNPYFNIFADDCYETSKKNILEKKFDAFVIKTTQAIKNPSDFISNPNVKNQINAFTLQKRLRNSSPDSPDSDSHTKVLNMIEQSNYNNIMKWFKINEILKSNTKTTCVLTSLPHLKSLTYPVHDELRFRRSIDDYICTLVPDKSSPGSVITADGTRCLKGKTCSRSCETNKGEKLCCTTPCLYNASLKSFVCSSGQETISCIPQYSVITKSGKSCKADHECGKHGKNYYWCYTEGGSYDYCSPLIETDSGKTCKTDHPCGKHGKSYNWCYTEDGSYDYCNPLINIDQID